MINKLLRTAINYKLIPTFYKFAKVSQHSTNFALKVNQSFTKRFWLHKLLVPNSKFNVESIVSRISKSLFFRRTHPRPNSLLRALSGLAGIVQLRDQFQSSFQYSKPLLFINKQSMLSSTSDKFLFKSLLLNATKYSLGVGNLTPKDFLGSGCNSAVWSVGLKNTESINSSDLAVKVLYNYYDDSATVEVDENLQGIQWNLLRKQLIRECSTRPETGHPNIVPILGHFIDKAPPGKASEYADSRPDVNSSQSGQKQWVGSENFPEGFGMDKKTCYLLMPKFESTLSDLIDGKWKCSDSSSWDSPKIRYSIGPGSNLSSFPPSSPPSPNSTKSSDNSFLILNDTSSSCSVFNDSTRSIDIKTKSRATADYSDLDELHLPQNATLTDNEGFYICNKTPSLSADESRSFCTLDEPESISVISRPESSAVVIKSNSRLPLSTDEAIAVLAQIFEAIQELEQRNISHRDIKLNNFLVRQRNSKRSHDNREARLLNSNIHVALTDFGCAIPTKQPQSGGLPRVGSGSSFASMTRVEQQSEAPVERSSLDQLTSLLFRNPLFRIGDSSNEQNQTRKLSLASLNSFPLEHVSHSGNTALLAPEVATALKSADDLCPELYARADLWAAATLAYQLFGLPNPFYGDLDSATYKESELPQFPPSCPGPVALLMHDCLRRDPQERPPAHLVADVLHTICLVRHARRRIQRTAPNNARLMQASNNNYHPVQKLDDETSYIEKKLSQIDSQCLPDIDLLNLDSQSTAMCSELNKENLDYWQILSVSHKHISDGRLSGQLLQFLQVWWAADWLMGPARAPDGLRCIFYRRLTLDKLSLCLRLIRKFEARYSVMLAKRMFT